MLSSLAALICNAATLALTWLSVALSLAISPLTRTAKRLHWGRA